jgi:hypothetical protein
MFKRLLLSITSSAAPKKISRAALVDKLISKYGVSVAAQLLLAASKVQA